MRLLAEFRLRARHVVGPVLGVCLIAYIVYHAIQGERGLIAYWQLSAQVAQATATQTELRDERRRLERRVRLLRPESLDRDMLDERARYMLGYSNPDDVVIFLDPARRDDVRPR